MTNLILMLVLAGPDRAVFQLPGLLGAPESKLVSALGPKTAPKRVVFVMFYPKGVKEVKVNGFGDKMSYFQTTFPSIVDWKRALSSVGLDPKGVSARPVPAMKSAVTLRRSEVSLSGISHLPRVAKGAPWKVLCAEVAVLNQARNRALRPTIQAAAGPERVRLIQSCYDWMTELRFVR